MTFYDTLQQFVCASAVAVLVLCSIEAPAQGAPVSGYQIVAKYPHSTDSYTEGFFYLDGLFYEGTGMEGRSALLVIQPQTGMPVQQRMLPAKYFGEGIVDVGPSIYEWTWQTHVGFVIDKFSMREVRQFTYTGEGWGMTRDKSSIITSDGSDTLRFRNEQTFGETRHIVVHDGATKISQLNELEYIKGEIWSNVWHDNRIARISPKDGRVLSWVDLTGILPESQKKDAESVLNGIAYDAEHDRIFVTGKQWPTIFEIKVVPKK